VHQAPGPLADSATHASGVTQREEGTGTRPLTTKFARARLPLNLEAAGVGATPLDSISRCLRSPARAPEHRQSSK
jgi:hypothetical protein